MTPSNDDRVLESATCKETVGFLFLFLKSAEKIEVVPLIDSLAGFHQRRSSGFKGPSEADSHLKPFSDITHPVPAGGLQCRQHCCSGLPFLCLPSGYNMECSAALCVIFACDGFCTNEINTFQIRLFLTEEQHSRNL